MNNQTLDNYEFEHELQLSHQSFQHELIKALQQLPDKSRLVFNLYVMENLSHDEIEEYLGISASTSRSQLTKARKKLKQLLTHITKRNEFRRVG